MAGHSKFKNIMHRKGRQDAVRSKVFSKLAREITVAAKTGLADPLMNPRLRLAVANARAQSMPKDNIQRAIDKGAGVGGEDYAEIRYEGFGPGGVGVIVEALTDNRNRAAGDIRVAFSRNGGRLGETNTVVSGFERIGEIRYPVSVASEDNMMEAALEAGADDISMEEGDDDTPAQHVIICGFTSLNDVSGALASRFGDAISAQIIWRPHVAVELTGEAAMTMMKLVEALEDLDDVQNVHAGFEVSDEELHKFA
jgi:YebC/PmpR family DNA-binding regulatory protein